MSAAGLPRAAARAHAPIGGDTRQAATVRVCARVCVCLRVTTCVFARACVCAPVRACGHSADTNARCAQLTAALRELRAGGRGGMVLEDDVVFATGTRALLRALVEQVRGDA